MNPTFEAFCTNYFIVLLGFMKGIKGVAGHFLTVGEQVITLYQHTLHGLS